MFEDTPVSASSWKEIERIAEGWRRALDPENAWAPEILTLLERAKAFENAAGLQIIFAPDQEMGEDEGRAESDPSRIFVRQSLEEDAHANGPRARSTLAHEFAHIVLHPGLPKFRKQAGNAKIINLAPFRSAEAQAWAFARAFLMPTWLVEQVETPLELAQRCRASVEMAEIRLGSLKKAKPPLPAIETAIEKIRSAAPLAPVDTRVRAEREKNTAWERARHITGENPIRVRRSDDPGAGYRIEWRHYGNALSSCGWFIEDGRAMAYYGKDR